MTKQIKSKKRVKEHGEVFTNEREVKAMLDLVKVETENIEATFLEPACGDGNFLSEILSRKLSVVYRRYKDELDNYEVYSIVAIASLYGVDILQDNILICIERLYDIWYKEYSSVLKDHSNEKCKIACHYILTKNILCGDALTMLKSDGSPIIFSEWKFVAGTMIKRRDYELSRMLQAEQLVNMEECNLFNFDSKINEEVKKSIDCPIKEFPLVDYREVQNFE